MNNLKRQRYLNARDRVTFSVPSDIDVDATKAFQEFSPVTIKKAGAPWFTGVLTDISYKASGTQEGYSIEISGPRWYLENVVFEQEWIKVDPSGLATTLIPTTQTMTIVGQTIAGVKMNLGDVMLEALNYCIKACANGLDKPDGSNTGAIIPFTIGAMDPNIIIPYQQVKDKKCSELVDYCLKWIADGGIWFDYSQPVPVLNCAQRPTWVKKTIAVLAGANIQGFNPKPLYKLQVPAVVLKYDETNTKDGQTYASQIVDIWPKDAPNPKARNLVMNLDLVGGEATFTKQPVTVRPRPIVFDDAIAISWLKKHLTDLFNTDPSRPIYDTAHINLTALSTAIDPDDPEATHPDTGFALNAMTQELVTGQIADWMKTSGNIYACKATVWVTLTYTGSDAATLTQFNSDGTKLVGITIIVTNASTQIYQELTSLRASEPPPSGLAQMIYEQLRPLQWQGDLQLIEDECSDPLPVGCIFNTTDGRAAWQTMNAQVVQVEEDIDEGKTNIHFDAPLLLSAEDELDLYRANRGTVFTWRLQERTDGKSQGPVTVQGANHTPISSLILPPIPSSAKPDPYDGYDASEGATPKIKLYFGSHNNLPMTFGGSALTADIKDSPSVTVAAGSGSITAKVTFNTSGGAASGEVDLAAPGSNVVNADGSGVGYDLIGSYTATVVDGKAQVVFGPGIASFRSGQICGDKIQFWS